MVNANQAMAMSSYQSPIANGYRPAVASGCQSAATGDRSTPTSGQSTAASDREKVKRPRPVAAPTVLGNTGAPLQEPTSQAAEVSV